MFVVAIVASVIASFKNKTRIGNAYGMHYTNINEIYKLQA